VQTFLPYPSFERSARVLDPVRLGKQRVEALQVHRALIRPTYGWKHHPAVLMWAGHEEALLCYATAVCEEWRRRGHPDSCLAQMLDESRVGVPRRQQALKQAGGLPGWLGGRAFHCSHRSALVRKDPLWYRAHFPDVLDDLPYVWPVRSEVATLRPAL
jgi:hypothetical protein